MEMTHMQRAIPRELRRNVAFFSFLKLNVILSGKLVPLKVGEEIAGGRKGLAGLTPRVGVRGHGLQHKGHSRGTPTRLLRTRANRSVSSLARHVGMWLWGHP